jgi:hypothetical protein
MSEYQYYEFRAIDRPLTRDEMQELRALSTRAKITPTSFVNFYHYGDFRGNPDALMAKYFDAALYYSNWGTRWVILRLPRRLMDVERAERYCPGESAVLRATDDFVVLKFLSNEEPEDELEEEEDRLGSLIPLREALMRGDLRALYLGWLLCVQSEELEEEEVEPPVPPGLGKLTGPLQAFEEYLRIDEDLLAVAAEASPGGASLQPSREEWLSWIDRLPESEKNALLLRVADADTAHLPAELLQRFARDHAASVEHAAGSADAGRRTVGALLAAAERHAEERERREAEQQAAEQAHREREEAIARATYLDKLQGREPELWREAEAAIATKLPKNYDQAVARLVDLRDLAARAGTERTFEEQLRELRQRHAAKRTLIDRLNQAELAAPR